MYDLTRTPYVKLLLSGLVVVLFCTTAAAAIYRVDGTATGAGDGSSWADACTDLQTALDLTTGADDEIWIATGTYTPTTEIGGTGDRYRAFALKNGVAVYGGFAGSETSLSERDWETNEVILSADIGVAGDNTDNCYHVFYHVEDSFLDETAVLDGCTLTGGNGDVAGGDNRRGGGMYNEDASPTVANCKFIDNQSVGGSYSNGGGMCNYYSAPLIIGCTFSGNTAGTSGGAMANLYGASPRIIDCVFENNVAGLESSGLGDGSAIYNGNNCNPVFCGCTFEENHSNYNGGAVYNTGSSSMVRIVSCRFTDNYTGLYGGAIYNTGTDPEITQSIFNRNTATAGNGHGGVIYDYAASPTITNCVFYDNESGCVGNGIYNYQFSDPAITNCILQGDDVIYNAASSEPVVTYCNLQQTGYEAAELHNISADPGLADPENGDFNLTAGSPCIDAGDKDALPADVADLDDDEDTAEALPVDFLGYARCHDDTDVADTGNGTAPLVDMGVYEFGADASPVPEVSGRWLVSYPNPFNPATTIAYEVSADGPVLLAVHDLRGARIATLVDEAQTAGLHQIVWRGRDTMNRPVGSGVYFVNLQTSDGNDVIKVVLTK